MDGRTQQNGDWSGDTIRILKISPSGLWGVMWVEVAVAAVSRLFHEMCGARRDRNQVCAVGL
jgi:hypothetical protein